MTYLNCNLSSALPFNKGVVQGSGIGPSLFILMVSDQTICNMKKIFKYADDVTLLKPELFDLKLSEEFLNVQQWACNNNIVINLEKTKEIVFHKPNSHFFIMPPPLEETYQVLSAKLLSVVLSSNLKFNEHIKYLLGQCVTLTGF